MTRLLSSRRRFVAQIGAAGAALAVGGRAMGRSEVAQARKPVGYALVGIGKLTQTQLIPALKATKNARLVALVSGNAFFVADCVSTYAAHVSRLEAATSAGRFGLEPALYYHGIKGFRSDAKPFSFPDIDQFAAEMDDFAACARSGKPTRVPGEEGLRDVRIIEALYRSAATGRDIKL